MEKIGIWMKTASPNDYRILAKSRLPRFLFDYIDGGSHSEWTRSANESSLQDIMLRQRVLRDVSSISLETNLFGQSQKLPIILAPIGLAGMSARRGEAQAARAAESAGIPFTLSTVSVCTVDEVARAVERPIWFQLYMIRDRGFMRDLLAQARAARCTALVFTVDMPVPGTRYRDYRSGLAGASGFLGDMRRILQAMQHPRWAIDVGIFGRPHHLGNVAPVLKGSTGLEDFFAWMRNNFDPSVTWRDLDFIRQNWEGPLIIKGVLDADDAREAAAIGADGLVVSNHGGRQLDGAPPTAHVLAGIADAVGDRLAVLADGGVRSGLDVVRMLALGAKSVMLGRLWAYALVDGEAGVARMLKLIEDEMRVTMALCGVARIEDIGAEILAYR